MRAFDRLIAGKKHIRLLRALSPINQTRRSNIFGLLGGARGPFLAAAAMVMWVSSQEAKVDLINFNFYE